MWLLELSTKIVILYDPWSLSTQSLVGKRAGPGTKFGCGVGTINHMPEYFFAHLHKILSFNARPRIYLPFLIA